MFQLNAMTLSGNYNTGGCFCDTEYYHFNDYCSNIYQICPGMQASH